MPSEEQLAEQLRLAIAQHRAEAAAALGEAATPPDLAPGCRLDEAELAPRRSLPGRIVRRLRGLAFRLLARWYVRPMVAQQQNFNRAVTRRLGELLSREAALRERVEALERQAEKADGGKS